MPKLVDADVARAEIARAACRAIARRGLHKVRMVDIAEAGGVTTGMITNYFDGKDAIIAAALRVPFESLRRRIDERIESGERDLAELLDPAIPVTQDQAAETAVWVSFWGLAATDESLRPLNARLHSEGAEIFADAIRTAWPATRSWPRARFEDLRVAITTFVFGLSAAGVTSPGVWTPYVQREQLRAFVDRCTPYSPV
ncbi:MAG: TetR/AcrR family transcriptional regulator [Paracoccaceae bacterium]|nr:TetR/AcrR family transcriptional regulator [Paracoccaceae bacterium]